jgi:hypothetical protein
MRVYLNAVEVLHMLHKSLKAFIYFLIALSVTMSSGMFKSVIPVMPRDILTNNTFAGAARPLKGLTLGAVKC